MVCSLCEDVLFVWHVKHKLRLVWQFEDSKLNTARLNVLPACIVLIRWVPKCACILFSAAYLSTISTGLAKYEILTEYDENQLPECKICNWHINECKTDCKKCSGWYEYQLQNFSSSYVRNKWIGSKALLRSSQYYVPTDFRYRTLIVKVSLTTSPVVRCRMNVWCVFCSLRATFLYSIVWQLLICDGAFLWFIRKLWASPWGPRRPYPVFLPHGLDGRVV